MAEWAESSEKIPEYAYKPFFIDEQEVKDSAQNPDVYSVTELDVMGKLANGHDGEPCHVVMSVENKVFKINQTKIDQLRSCLFKSKKYSVQISTKISNEFVWFEIFFESHIEPLKIVNICNRFLHEKGGEVDYLCPRWMGEMPITVTDLLGTDSISKTFTVILDEEAIFLFSDFRKRIPDYRMSFYKESTETSIEKAMVQHVANKLVLESLAKQFVIENASQHSEFKDKLKMIRPKPKAIFEDHSELVKYVKDLNQVFLQRRQEREEKIHVREDWDTEINTKEKIHGREDWDTEINTSTPYMRAVSEAETANKQASIFARELDEAFEKLSVVEDISLPWIVAEDEIRQMIENPEGLADSDRDVLSGGLDPNSPDHLIRSFTEIKELLTQQRYDMALSRLKGTKMIFKETEMKEIKNLMIIDDLELLTKLYYHSFF